MTGRLLLSNLTSFVLQTTVLVAAGAALARGFRIDSPKALLACWRAVLLVALILPLCQPWQAVPPEFVAIDTVVPPSVAPSGEAAAVAVSTSTLSISDAILALLAAGIFARAAWLAIGAFGLRRLRRDARPLDPLPESVRDAQRQTGTEAGMYVSERISGPITYGVLRPVVVFPPSVAAMPAHVQTAIACHELIHVRRRDWLQEIVEEGVRCALWFHPAIWWLIGRIQLAREEVVDQAAIRLTDSKERYVESLLAVAVAQSRVTFTPASSFLRRHLLKKRVARILQESTMTTRRLIASLTASAAALALATAFAVRSFPLEAQGRETPTGAPIQLIRGGDQLVHGELPEYPERAVERKVEGDVVVDMSLNDRGEVSDARVLSGPDELRKAALEAVLRWHYSPVLSSTDVQATLRFHLPPAGLQAARLEGKYRLAEDAERKFVLASDESEAQLTEHRLIEITRALEDPLIPAAQRAELREKEVAAKMMLEKIKAEDREIPFEVKPDEPVEVALRERRHMLDGPLGRLSNVRTERVSAEVAKDVLSQAGVAIGDTINKEAIERLRQAAASIDPHFRVEFEKTPNGIVLTLLTR